MYTSSFLHLHGQSELCMQKVGMMPTIGISVVCIETCVTLLGLVVRSCLLLLVLQLVVSYLA